MKKFFYLSLAIAFSVITMGFINSDKTELEYPEFFTYELKEVFKSQYVETIENMEFHKEIENELSMFVDDVIRVDLQYSEEGSFYYHSIYGSKDGKQIIQLIRLDRQSDYTDVDMSNFGDCIQAPPPGICPSPGSCCTGPCESDKPGQEMLLCMLCLC